MAFIQGVTQGGTNYGNGTIYQSIPLLTNFEYTITVAAAQRLYNGTTDTQSVQVSVASASPSSTIGTVYPTGTNATIYEDYSVGPFTESTAGSYALTFAGQSTSGDETLLFDNVRIAGIGSAVGSGTASNPSSPSGFSPLATPATPAYCPAGGHNVEVMWDLGTPRSVSGVKFSYSTPTTGYVYLAYSNDPSVGWTTFASTPSTLPASGTLLSLSGVSARYFLFAYTGSSSVTSISDTHLYDANGNPIPPCL